MWFLRRMMKISWVDPRAQWYRKSFDILALYKSDYYYYYYYQTMKYYSEPTPPDNTQTIITRQIRVVGHVIRKGKLEYLMLTEKIDCKRARGSPTFDISRLVGTIYWHKTTGPYHKVAKTTRERCCGCCQRQDPGMTLGLDWKAMQP